MLSWREDRHMSHTDIKQEGREFCFCCSLTNITLVTLTNNNLDTVLIQGQGKLIPK